MRRAKTFRNSQWTVAVVVLLLAATLVYFFSSKNSISQLTNSNSTTPSAHCVYRAGLPDHTCTPGSTDSRVIQANIQQTICVSGYTKTVRPSVSYTDNLKKQQMAEYGDTDSPANYEEDHLIPLEVGGNPTDPKNLWPEPRNTSPSANDKDGFENYLHQKVCSGQTSLEEAQGEISTDWAGFWFQAGSPK